MSSYILRSNESLGLFEKQGGGKATNLARLTQHGFPVPSWFCILSPALKDFIQENDLERHLKPNGDLKAFSQDVEKRFLDAKLPKGLEAQLSTALLESELGAHFSAVRSSGLEEDSAEHSFAGQFSSYLFQKGMPQIEESLKRCWASAFSERALSYRLERGLKVTDLEMAVVIQRMVNADAAGVAFSRNPIHPLDRDNLVISSVWGLGEGLVSGELDADHFKVDRTSLGLKHSDVVEKLHALRQADMGGLVKLSVAEELKQVSSLKQNQIQEVAQLVLDAEKKFGAPQDSEWAYEGDRLYLVQTRPITNLPREAFFDKKVIGEFPILWDNSNIIESYSGVTSPLTFSFASDAYRQVYIQFCEVVGVPKNIIDSNESMFRNMLGLLRGNIYYNLINWYKLVLLLPGSGNNKGFMDTMMGVKQKLDPDMAAQFDQLTQGPRYSIGKRVWVSIMTGYRFIRIDSIVGKFQTHFKTVYEEVRKLPFQSMSLTDLLKLYERLDHEILRRWQAPIINDYLCMIFFGVLKKLTFQWIDNSPTSSLQNDLLCGEGNLESTEPTMTLMRIAEYIDRQKDLTKADVEFKTWFTQTEPSLVWAELKKGKGKDVYHLFLDFLDRYGFRCINELKLEASDLHDDPSFVVGAVASYVRMKSYSVTNMKERELEIRHKAEAQVKAKISGFKRLLYFFILRQARKAVKNRENLRFARTKIFGVARHLFRAVGSRLTTLGILNNAQDVFYLTVPEIFSLVEGRAVSLNLGALVQLRKQEYERFEKSPAPPDRLVTKGAVGVWCLYPQVLAGLDLLQGDPTLSSADPNVLVGTPCCPGVIEGIVRVVEKMEDAQNLKGEILVTGRTDPGWVPLYPSCSGLLIERGSLLSHSAVVARELGLPTIVGISGGLMKKLKTGQRVRVDAGKGEVRILE